MGKAASDRGADGPGARPLLDFDDFKQMLRNLLADRFKLKTHMGEVPIDAYTLGGSRPEVEEGPSPEIAPRARPAPAPDGKDPRITNPDPLAADLLPGRHHGAVRRAAPIARARVHQGPGAGFNRPRRRIRLHPQLQQAGPTPVSEPMRTPMPLPPSDPTGAITLFRRPDQAAWGSSWCCKKRPVSCACDRQRLKRCRRITEPCTPNFKTQEGNQTVTSMTRRARTLLGLYFAWASSPAPARAQSAAPAIRGSSRN